MYAINKDIQKPFNDFNQSVVTTIFNFYQI